MCIYIRRLERAEESCGSSDSRDLTGLVDMLICTGRGRDRHSPHGTQLTRVGKENSRTSCWTCSSVLPWSHPLQKHVWWRPAMRTCVCMHTCMHASERMVGWTDGLMYGCMHGWMHYKGILRPVAHDVFALGGNSAKCLCLIEPKMPISLGSIDRCNESIFRVLKPHTDKLIHIHCFQWSSYAR